MARQSQEQMEMRLKIIQGMIADFSKEATKLEGLIKKNALKKTALKADPAKGTIKRGRKPKVEVEAKKRGRKPKAK